MIQNKTKQEFHQEENRSKITNELHFMGFGPKNAFHLRKDRRGQSRTINEGQRTGGLKEHILGSRTDLLAIFVPLEFHCWIR